MTQRRPSSRWRVFLVTFAVSFSLMTLWSLASPLMSLPDEPSHVTYAAAAARGQFIGDTSVDASYAIVRVPAYVEAAADFVCFLGNPAITADCQGSLPLGDAPELVDGITTSTLNSPVYFVLTGLPTLFVDGPVAFYLMRAVSALLCSVLLAIAAFALSQLPRASLSLLALVGATTPMLLFLGGGVNPNGVEVCATLAVVSLLLLLGRDRAIRGRLLNERLVLLVFAVFMLVNTRSLALAWLLAAVVVGLAMCAPGALRALFSHRATWIAFATTCAVVVAAVVWFLIPKGLGASDQLAVGTDVEPWDAFGRMIAISPRFTIEWVGVFGWLDTLLPLPIYVAYALVCALLVVWALRVGTRGQRWLLIGVGAAIVLVPAIAQAALISQWGWVWQGRYHLALFGILMVTAGVIADSRSSAAPRWQANASTVLFASLGALQIAAFVIALQRYAVGSEAPLVTMWTSPLWQPPLGLLPLSFAFAVAMTIAVVTAARGSRYWMRPPVA